MSENNNPDYLNSILNTFPEAVIITDASGSIEFLNAKALSLLEYNKEEILGKNINSIITEGLKTKKLQTETEICQPSIWKTKSGKQLQVIYSRSPISVKDKQNSPIVYLTNNGVILARTDQDSLNTYLELGKVKEELIESEKMATIGRVASGFAHELKNPLTIIIQGVYLIGSILPEKNNEVSEVIGIIKNAVNRIDEIICRLLEYTRTSKLVAATCDIADIIDKGISIIEGQAKIRGVTIERNYPTDAIFIYGDKTTLAQVFLNLAKNSMEAMPSGGKISIKVCKDKEFCVVEFSDNGHGIDKNDLDKIFDPFFSTKSDNKSMGIGLAMVRAVMERHNGFITAESNLGKGTKFIMKFPNII